jgi:hypothetical protein
MPAIGICLPFILWCHPRKHPACHVLQQAVCQKACSCECTCSSKMHMSMHHPRSKPDIGWRFLVTVILTPHVCFCTCVSATACCFHLSCLLQSPALNASLTSLLSNIGASASHPGVEPCSTSSAPAAAAAAPSEPGSTHGSTQHLLGSGASDAPSGPQQEAASSGPTKTSRSSRVSRKYSCPQVQLFGTADFINECATHAPHKLGGHTCSNQLVPCCQDLKLLSREVEAFTGAVSRWYLWHRVSQHTSSNILNIPGVFCCCIAVCSRSTPPVVL